MPHGEYFFMRLFSFCLGSFLTVLVTWCSLTAAVLGGVVAATKEFDSNQKGWGWIQRDPIYISINLSRWDEVENVVLKAVARVKIYSGRLG